MKCLFLSLAASTVMLAQIPPAITVQVAPINSSSPLVAGDGMTPQVLIVITNSGVPCNSYRVLINYVDYNTGEKMTYWHDIPTYPGQGTLDDNIPVNARILTSTSVGCLAFVGPAVTVGQSSSEASRK